jgi:hypothetical protein
MDSRVLVAVVWFSKTDKHEGYVGTIMKKEWAQGGRVHRAGVVRAAIFWSSTGPVDPPGRHTTVSIDVYLDRFTSIVTLYSCHMVEGGSITTFPRIAKVSFPSEWRDSASWRRGCVVQNVRGSLRIHQVGGLRTRTEILSNPTV